MEQKEEEGFSIDSGKVLEKLSNQVRDLSLKTAMQEAVIDQLQAELTEARDAVDKLGKEQSNGAKRTAAAKG